VLNVPDTAILDLEISLFKDDRCFDFITVVNGKKHLKQEEALYLLTDDVTEELLYGGAAGGAKSWTGAAWLAMMCLSYPETRWFIGREELKRLRDSTLLTFFKVCKAYSIKRDIDFKYNGQDHYIQFSNGSRIDLLDLKYLPSDPLYERYGSVEYTGGWIEEGGEVNFSAFDTLKSRVGRHMNDIYGLLGKIFITCNPKKNWLYTYFYLPAKNGALKKIQKFLKCLLGDNPHRESGYESKLQGLTDKSKKERLYFGNWEYDDDPTVLCDYDAICDMFTNDHVKTTGKRYISADMATRGRDRFIVSMRDGMVIDFTKGADKEKSTAKENETTLRNISTAHSVPRSQIVADSDGLGDYLESYLNGIKEFKGGTTANDKKTYFNLKSECAFKLAELINKREIKVICSQEQRERIIEEVGVLKEMSVDDDEKRKRIISKDEMKELLGRSPDYLDDLIMHMYFEVKPKGITLILQ
jgi:phage terminase large subunit